MTARHLSNAASLIGTGFVWSAFGMLFLLDSISSDLYGADLTTGRIKACYVWLELWIGSLAPTSWARPVELGIGITLLVLAFLSFSAVCGRGTLAPYIAAQTQRGLAQIEG
jgi:heme exporter protein D